jgi:excisionase family DNA binding protein
MCSGVGPPRRWPLRLQTTHWVDMSKVEGRQVGDTFSLPPPLVDIPTIASLLGVTERHVRRLVFEERIPYFKVGRYVRFDTAEIASWLQDHRPTQWRCQDA